MLSRLSANDIDREVGRVVYTQWLDARGGIMADLTVTRTGHERFLVVASDIIHRRVEALPDGPNVAEIGFKDFETSQWYGVLAPAGTPPELVKRIQEECNKALKSSAVTARFANDSAVGGGGPSKEFADFIAREQAIWKDIVKRASIKPD